MVFYLAHCDTLSQNMTNITRKCMLFYHKIRQQFITKCVSFLLQNAKVLVQNV